MKQLFKSKLLNAVFQHDNWTEEETISELLMKIEYPEVSLEKQYSLRFLIKNAQNHEMFPFFIDAMNHLNEQMLYHSCVHGKNHIERTAFYSFLLCIFEKLNTYETRLCVESAKYHDIGRLSDGEDPLHGLIGAKRYTKQVTGTDGFTEEDIQIIAFIIASHCVDEVNAYKFIEHLFSISEENYTMCKKILDIVKDADALDRFRLSAHSLNTRFLRTENAETMIRAAFELYYFSKKQ